MTHAAEITIKTKPWEKPVIQAKAVATWNSETPYKRTDAIASAIIEAIDTPAQLEVNHKEQQVYIWHGMTKYVYADFTINEEVYPPRDPSKERETKKCIG